MSKPSSFGNVHSDGSSLTVTSKDEMKPPLVYNATGTQHSTVAPSTLPSFTLPSSPFYSGNVKNTQGAMPPDLCVVSPSPVMSSGIPDFPDNISQQFKTLKNQAKGASNHERLFSQELPGHKDLLYNTNGRPPVVQKVPGHFEFGRPPDVTLHSRDQEFKGNLESFLKQVISGNSSTEDWKKISHANSTEKKELDLELSKKGSHNQNMSAAHSSDNKTQVPNNESQRTSNRNTPIQTNGQNFMFSGHSQIVHQMTPNHNANRPHLQQKANTTYQLPHQNTFNTLPKEPMFRPPPAIQRQFQPFARPQGFSQAVPGNMSQARFALLPTPRSSWQQGPVVQRPVSAGRMPYQYPQGTNPFQPQFSSGRAHPTAAARPARQSLGVAIPFIPTIHQKLLILVRGLPGSGKSSLAQRLKGAHGVVFSTDDYFYRNQRYEFDVSLLGEAHGWNQQRAKSALEKLQSPVIIDNTNTQAWEMKPYVSMALKYGYQIKFVEPDTSWKWNVKELARRNQHGVSIAAIIRMKERYEHGVTVEMIINSERKLDANKTGNETETRKETGADNQNGNRRPQSSPQERGSQELGTRKVENYGVASREKTTPKVAESAVMSSLRAIEGHNSLAAKEERFQGLRNASEKGFDGVEESDSGAKNGEKTESCTSVVHGIDISELGNGADEVITEETDSNSGPKPQRIQRIRERKSPNRQQLTSTELSTLGCEDETSDGRQDTFTSCASHNELDVSSESCQENAAQKGNAVFRVEKLSTLASLANSCMSSTSPYSSGNVEDILAGIEVVDESESSISSLSESPLADYISPVLNASSVGSAEQENAENSDLSNEHIEGELTCDVEFPDRQTPLSLTLPLEDDVTDAIADSGNDVVKHREPLGSNSSRNPPPLSAILASASRTRLKRRSRSNSDPTQLTTDSVDSPQENGLKLLLEPNQADKSLELNESLQSVSDVTSTQETNTSVEDVSTGVQNLPNLSDLLPPSSSGDSQNDMTAGVEFLKTCFPDVDSEVMNALLTTNSGDVMKVVDELLASGRTVEKAEEMEANEQNAFSTELPTFPDSLLLPSQPKPFYVLNEEKNPLIPTKEIVKVAQPAGGLNQQSSDTRVNGEISSGASVQENTPSQPRNLGPRPLAQAQSPGQSNAATFQLTLEPAVALHLIEMFGSLAGVDFQEDISHEDLIIDVDSSLARQLYKKWEKSIQIRKGIATARGSSPKTKREPTGNDLFQLSRDQASSNSQRSPSRLRKEPQAGNLREIMDEQLALELSRNVPDVTEQDIATKLKRQKLYEMFPGIDPVALEEVFQANRFELAPSVEAVKASCNLHGREIPSTVIASGFSGRVANQGETTRKEAEEDWSWLDLDASSQPRSDEASFQTLDEPSYLDYRAEAFQHCKQRDECFKKAALAFSKKQGQLAQFYAQQGHMHTEKIKEANARAAALILDQKNESTDENTIDLHGLHVTEAIEALESMLMERTEPHGGQSRRGCKSISVVTGRGNHSRGGKARIKPAILEYLKKHNYRFTEPHPGLVKVYL
ncbi:NEDD4-binding protein 2-like isoform X2 [Oculina patagonica]